MKDGIHPKYQEVVFQDSSTGTQFLMRSTIRTEKKVQYEGRELPLVTVDISAASHPFFTGKQKFVDTAGRVEKFQKKYNWAARGGKPAEEGK
ncbi:MAG: type B 50S ribosomal protein L31 [Planctomycetaceae bacterium]|nr:type B 50S ribosomal protein L31 [Planctomycetaceae bacterium]